MAATKRPTLLLSRQDVIGLLDISECIAAIEKGVRLLGEGRLPPPEIFGLHGEHGGLHVKAATWKEQTSYFVAKANANFPGNPQNHDLPTIQGVIIVCDANNGELLAMIDSIEITAQRTGAATAVAAKWLARPTSRTLTICGCGTQGVTQLQALRSVLPIERVFAFDIDPDKAERFANDASHRFEVHATAAHDLPEAVAGSDIVATCTSSTQPFIHPEHVRPGTFIAAVGADNEHKQEIDPRLFPLSKVVVDSLAQCSRLGDLHHAIAAGTIAAESVHAELADVVAGKRVGRTSDAEITVFGSTGIAIEDAAAAVFVYEKAVQSKSGTSLHF